MRILIVAGSYPPDRCGVGDYTRQLAMALAKDQSVTVGVLTTGIRNGEEKDEDVSVFRTMPDWSLRRIGALQRAIRAYRPDIVHVQYPTQGYRDGGLPWLIPMIGWLCGSRVVQTWHESFNRRDLGKFMIQALVPSKVVVVRKAYRQQFRSPFGLFTGLKRPRYINSASTLPPTVFTPDILSDLRKKYQVGDRRLIVFFGFIHPLKRVDWLFQLADPATDYVIVAGAAEGQSSYLQSIEALTLSEPWAGKSRVIGFVEPPEAAAILQAADALVLPLQAGGGEWNTSILAGIQQGTLVVTTSAIINGYDLDTNVYYARIDDMSEMKQALDTYSGSRRVADKRSDAFDWRSIAARHLDLYRALLPKSFGPKSLQASKR